MGEGPGVRDSVGVRVGVRVREGVMEGSTRSVFVGWMVAEGVTVMVGVSVRVGVDVIWLSIRLCACSPETGVISLDEQNCPVMVQAMSIWLWSSGTGSEGGLMDSVPFSPPNCTVDFSPAPTYCSCPLETTRAEPSYTLISMSPFLIALMLALPIRVNSEPLTLKRIPLPSGEEIIMPSNGTFSQTI